MLQQAAKGVGVPLAKDRKETANVTGKIVLTSTSFKDGAAIPQKHSEYADGVSPHLTWTPVAGAKSCAIIAEDPDAKPITPFVHWMIFNIPANITSLPEGLQEQARLTEPDGVLQGKTSRGSVAYLGPRPPVGEPPHRYHFQILALDTELNLQPGADRDEVLAAANGHVLAKGLLVGKIPANGKGTEIRRRTHINHGLFGVRCFCATSGARWRFGSLWFAKRANPK